MATIQTDGFTPVTPTSTDNNGGTVRANGGASGTFATVATNRQPSAVFGSTPVDNADADPAIDGGDFAYNNQQPISKKVTSVLAGASPADFMRSGAGDPTNIQSIHKIESVTTRKLTTAIRENKWNEYSGKFDAGYPQVQNDTFYSIRDNGVVVGESPIDDAASPSRTNPGDLTYMQGNPNPLSTDYPVKTS
jgi:hypothetical protein